MSTLRQFSMSGGELSPALHGRSDLVKYQTGLRTCKNNLILRSGGSASRPGTTFVERVKYSTYPTDNHLVRLIPFIFNSDQAYVLEFGNAYLRVVKDGEYIIASTKTITNITNASPAVVTSAGHGLSNSQSVLISGVVGLTSVNNRQFVVAGVTTNTFQLKLTDLSDFDTSLDGAYISGGSADVIYEVATSYLERDLPELNYIQSADVLTITHQNYYPLNVSRIAEDSWELSSINFHAQISSPINLSITNSGTATYWVVTAVAEDTYEESIQSVAIGSSIAASALSGTPQTITWTMLITDAFPASPVEYNVYRALNGVYGYVGTTPTASFIDNGITIDFSLTPPVSRNPFSLGTAKAITGISQANPAVVSATSHGLTEGDLIYISGVVGMTQVNDRYFFVGEVLTVNTFELVGFDGVDINSTDYTAWSSGGSIYLSHNYPKVAAYFQQRLAFANTRNNPETVFLSKTGLFYNFNLSRPSQDDDAITFTLAGKQVNSIEHLLDLLKLVVFTSGGEWTVEGDQASILRPTDINPRQQTYNGSSKFLSPLVVGGNALYAQARGSVIRDLGFDYQVDGYRGNDLTIFASHLFDNYTLIDWAYQQIPNSLAWVVRSDGVLLSLTYIREHQIFAWHQHDLGGLVENVCCIPEGNEDVLYCTVKRTIDGRDETYLERLSTRKVEDIVDYIGMDSVASYDGRNTGSTTMTLSGSGWTHNDTLTLTASVATFASTDIGNAIHLTGSDGTEIRCTITAYTNTTVVSITPHMDVPVSMQATAITDWSHAVDELSGLWHLEGETVSVFADGFVVASPNNASYDSITVENGAITLSRPYAVIHVGVPFMADLETLDIDIASAETMADKKKLVTKVSVQVEDSRGIWVGARPPTDDDTDPLEGLTEIKVRLDESYDDSVSLQTGVLDVQITPCWSSNGRIFIRQVDPCPMSILSIYPSGLFPIRGGS